jgi:AcrR family transcriptional regulator
MKFEDFKKQVAISKRGFYRDIFSDNRKSIRIKKEKTVVKNLERIFEAVLKISNVKGFQAMSMRELAQETGLSMGALYAYFSSKDELVEMLQRQSHTVAFKIWKDQITLAEGPREQLKVAVYSHLFLSEVMRPWYYFSFMEAKNLSKKERKRALEVEGASEQVLADIIENGQAAGIFEAGDARLIASLTKAMMQDWYLKRSKYVKTRVPIETYADMVFDLLESRLVTEK